MTAIRFRLYPERPDKRFYRVLIFATKPEMYAYYDDRTARREITYAPGFEPDHRHNFGAHTIGYEQFTRTRGSLVEIPTNNVGELLFHEGYMGAGVVAHEMTHAAHFWLDRQGLCFSDMAEPAVEERVCGIVGELCRHFWRHYFSRAAAIPPQDDPHV